ncbi:MAG: hypothetical protein LC685_05655 [Actinobacteria bacterium]|nr:hypothetical protein [Actinomycetota bacterium]
MTRYRWGRLLQMVGLFILPFSVVSEVVEKVGLGRSMLVSAGGMLVFYTGYLLQNRSNEAG